MVQENGEKRLLWKIIDVLVVVMLTVSLALSSYALANVVSLQARVTALEAVMKVTDLGGVLKEFTTIRQELAKLPQESPPLWFVQRIDRMEKTLLDKIVSLALLVKDNAIVRAQEDKDLWKHIRTLELWGKPPYKDKDGE